MPDAVAPAISAKLRAICASLPESFEERAWVGTRRKVRSKTFAHVIPIVDGTPTAYAVAAGSDGPLTVLTVRIELSGVLVEPRFFEPIWGSQWGTKVLGLALVAPIDWNEVRVLVTESYRLLAPKKLVARIDSAATTRAKPR